jgi:hypothetical protein
MLLLYVIRRAGTFTMEEKVRLIEFVAHLAQNPDADINLSQIQETSIRRLT